MPDKSLQSLLSNAPAAINFARKATAPDRSSRVMNGTIRLSSL